MNLAICLASRARPLGLLAVVGGAHRLASDQNQVSYVLGLDADDDWAEQIDRVVSSEIGADVTLASGPPPTVRGQIENRMIEAAKKLDPDAVTLLSDRTVIISPRWDTMLAAAVAKAPNRVLWWSCQEDPGCIIPIMPKAYLNAIDWTWSDEIFPFWWEDTWHQEIDLLVHGAPSLKAKVFYAGARGKTRNARDFGFWMDVFTATRGRRRILAAHVAHALKVEMREHPQVEQYFLNYDRVMRERIKIFEDNFGDPNPPDENYLAAKAKAEQLLALSSGTGTKAA